MAIVTTRHRVLRIVVSRAMHMQAQEAQIVLRAMDGDSEAMSWLVTRYRSSVCRYIQSRIEDHEVAQDLTQDSFVRALRAIEGLRTHQAFRKWLYAIARRVTLDFVRRREVARSRYTEATAEEIDSLEIVDRSEPIDCIVHREALHARQRVYAWLMSGIGGLPPSDREVLLLRYVTDLPCREIAEVCELSVGAVKLRLYRARARLKEQLGVRRWLSRVAERGPGE